MFTLPKTKNETYNFNFFRITIKGNLPLQAVPTWYGWFDNTKRENKNTLVFAFCEGIDENTLILQDENNTTRTHTTNRVAWV